MFFCGSQTAAHLGNREPLQKACLVLEQRRGCFCGAVLVHRTDSFIAVVNFHLQIRKAGSSSSR